MWYGADWAMSFHCPHVIGYTGNTYVTDEYFLL
jgi:hypothetical protein